MKNTYKQRLTYNMKKICIKTVNNKTLPRAVWKEAPRDLGALLLKDELGWCFRGPSIEDLGKMTMLALVELLLEASGNKVCDF